MATHPLWSDEYWLLLLQLYQHKPAGVKPLYSRQLVKLSLELHIPPQNLYEQQFVLRQRNMPVMRLIWETYADNQRKLNRDVRKLRALKGFGQPKEFYEGVEVKETFEKDFMPLPQNERLKPVMLIMILD